VRLEGGGVDKFGRNRPMWENEIWKKAKIEGKKKLLRRYDGHKARLPYLDQNFLKPRVNHERASISYKNSTDITLKLRNNCN
jgi:hypothetical protein